MAIARDAKTGAATTGTSLTYTHTCTGSNLVLVVNVLKNTLGADPSGVTYNSVNMTKVTGQDGPGGVGRTSQWILINPATGGNSVVITLSDGSQSIEGNSISYTGCKQSGQPDASNNGTTATATSTSPTVTAVAANCWAVVGAADDSDTSGWTFSNLTLGTSQANGDLDADTNGTIAAGSFTGTITSGGAVSQNWSWNILTLAPLVAAASPGGSLTTLGVGA